MSGNDTEYFRNRAGTEHALAATANDPLAAEIHLELARRYEKLLRDANRPTLHLALSRRQSAHRTAVWTRRIPTSL